jgi:CYTH domain-containing protein/predicted ATPase
VLPIEQLLDTDNLAGLALDREEKRRLYEVVVTGGPCAGKTTALAVLRQKLSDYGFTVLVAPETATLVIGAGVDVVGTAQSGDARRYLELQRQILRMQRALRERMQAFADLYEGPVVVLYDRGEMDNAAYVDYDDYAALLEEERLTSWDVRDSYDLVIHLVTAADGAEEAYTLDNNAARSESLELARELDGRTLAAWVGHPRLRIVDNSTGFDAKINRALRAVAQALGRPAPLELERKFLLAADPDLQALAALAPRVLEIEQTYLTSPDPRLELRLRRRVDRGQASYYRTEKVTLYPGARLERERALTPSEYRQLLALADPSRATIRKTRYCFTFDSLYFELDRLHEPEELWLLEVELTEGSEPADRPKVPAGLDLGREVTGDEQWTNAAIAARRS